MTIAVLDDGDQPLNLVDLLLTDGRLDNDGVVPPPRRRTEPKHMGAAGEVDADREAVQAATEEAAREGRAFCPFDAWARATAARLGERWLAAR